MSNKFSDIRIRAGKDIVFKVQVTTNESDVSLEGRDLALSVLYPDNHERKLAFEIVDGNFLKFHFRSKRLGSYFFSIYENWKQEIGATVVDIPQKVELVPHTWEEGGSAAEGLDLETITLKSVNMEVLNGGTKLSKEAIEKLLTGDITTHNHATEIQTALKRGHYVSDDKYVHTDENFTADYKRQINNLSNFNGSIESANKAAADAAAAAKKASEVVNTMPHVEVIETINE